MWVMTSWGILMPSLRPPATVPDGDDRVLQVRARRDRDLNILRALYLPELGETIHTPTFDYNYRAYCTKAQFAAAMAKVTEDIDYEKFKPTTDRFNDNELHGVYNSIWGTVCKLGTPWEAYKGHDPNFIDSGYGWYDRAQGTSKTAPKADDKYSAMSVEMDELDDMMREGYIPHDYSPLPGYEANRAARSATKRGQIYAKQNPSRRERRRARKVGNQDTGPIVLSEETANAMAVYGE